MSKICSCDRGSLQLFSAPDNFAGVHELAAEQGRVVVSGHAANVGIVGFSLGGGHGQLVPLHGMGVDQVTVLMLL